MARIRLKSGDVLEQSRTAGSKPGDIFVALRKLIAEARPKLLGTVGARLRLDREGITTDELARYLNAIYPNTHGLSRYSSTLFGRGLPSLYENVRRDALMDLLFACLENPAAGDRDAFRIAGKLEDNMGALIAHIREKTRFGGARRRHHSRKHRTARGAGAKRRRTRRHH
jgi:hypothetical protein